MEFLSQINELINGKIPEQVPFMAYDNLVPRGEFSRVLRDLGMGLCFRCSTVTAEIPDVRIEIRVEDGHTIKTCHTPAGPVSSRVRLNTGRISDNPYVEIEGMIKAKKDFDPVIYMIENTQFKVNKNIYMDLVQDIGRDGIVKDRGLMEWETTPYGASVKYFGEIHGLTQWVYAQVDYPDHFQRLLDALERREDRRLHLVADSPAKFIGFGWLEGIWSPNRFKQYELPFYQKWVPYLQDKGKICVLHADAINLAKYVDLICQTRVAMVEAFTPPPVGDLALQTAREIWGPSMIIWLNFPESMFWHGVKHVRQYTRALLESDPPGNPLIIGFTEMGIYGATDIITRRIFVDGCLAVLNEIQEYGKHARLDNPKNGII